MKNYLQGNTTLQSLDFVYTDALGIQQYAFNSLLFLRVVQDKYISLYKELITQLRSYVSAIRVLMKGYLPTTLITPSKLQGNFGRGQEIITTYQSRLCLSFRKTTFILQHATGHIWN